MFLSVLKEFIYLTQLIGPWFLNEASHPLSRRRLPSTPQTPRMAALVPRIHLTLTCVPDRSRSRVLRNLHFRRADVRLGR